MIQSILNWMLLGIVNERLDLIAERRVQRQGYLGVPVVALVATVVASASTAGWALLERRDVPPVSAPIWVYVLVAVRLALVVMAAVGLRQGRTTPPGRGLTIGLTVALAVNLLILFCDTLMGILANLINVTRALSPLEGQANPPAWWVPAFLAATIIAVVADVALYLALTIRRRALP